MKSAEAMQTQIGCALVHLMAAKALLADLGGVMASVAASEVQLGIDRLEDRWDTVSAVLRPSGEELQA